jgi:hypothetical protein
LCSCRKNFKNFFSGKLSSEKYTTNLSTIESVILYFSKKAHQSKSLCLRTINFVSISTRAGHAQMGKAQGAVTSKVDAI